MHHHPSLARWLMLMHMLAECTIGQIFQVRVLGGRNIVARP